MILNWNKVLDTCDKVKLQKLMITIMIMITITVIIII